MSFTTPIYIPLVKGMDLSKDAVLGDVDLTLAQNVDFSIQGQVRGRPGRGTVSQFLVRDPSGTSTYFSPQSLVASGFRPSGLMRFRDATDERPMLGTDGRLFVREGTQWKDRGAFACMKVDQPHTYVTQVQGVALKRPVMGPDFGAYTLEANSVPTLALLNPTTLGFERTASSGVSTLAYGAGTMARCGSVTATVYVNFGNAMRITLRSAGGALVETVIAADAAMPAGDGDAPCITCDHDQTAFYVIYQTTTANQYKVLRVNTSGTVLNTFTGTLANIHGHWVSNSAVADNMVVVALTGPDGLTTKILNATTLVDLARDRLDTTVGCDAREVVVGVESATRAWYCYRRDGSGTDPRTKIGTVNPSTAGAMTTAKNYSARASDGSGLGCGNFTPMHQPVKFGGRMYLTLGATTPSGAFASASVLTWFTLDLSNFSAGATIGPFANPTIVARGRTDGTGSAIGQPEGAVLLQDSTGWTFPSHEWVTYSTDIAGSAAGQQAVTLLNRVQLSSPRCVNVGNATLFSGSVPRTLDGNECFEAGFPQARPTMQLNPSGGGLGGLPAGSYTIYVCWSYTDGSGQIHRSAPSGMTQDTSASSYIDVYVQTPFITERPYNEVKLEIYSTGLSPATDDPAYLQTVITVASTLPGSTVWRMSTPPVTNTEVLYSLRGEFSHITPNADGGIAALGRRVWVADRNTVYASLLLQPRKGIAWNDEGSLSVTLPAGAGRILALEGMEDKLVVFAERGIWLVQDGGPDNTGLGPDISFPIRVSDLGVAGPRSTCTTDMGVVFCTPLDSTDPQRGGPWLLDRSLSLTDRKFLGPPALDYFLGNGSWVPEVAFSPERQQVYVTVPEADEHSPANTGVVVIDYRQEKWSTWSANDAYAGDLRSIAVVDGVLWDLRNEPCPYDQKPGFGGADFSDAVDLRIRTTHLSANGHDGLGWARVRSVSVLGPPDIELNFLTAYNVIIMATMDQTRQYSTTMQVQVPSLSDSTWPGSRTAPEWRLPTQKCGSLQVELQTSVHSARWTALRLEVQPLPPRTPASNRS